MSEQRQSRRIRRDAVQVRQVAGKRLPAKVSDFSLSGACLRVPITVVPGECLELVLVETFSGRAQRMRGRVQWSRGGELGLKWVDLGAEQDDWVRSLVGFWLGETAASQI